MNYPKVAIPSYQRSNLISEMTLKFLHQENYPSSLIFIFVASDTERQEYATNVPRHLYCQIIVGVLGLKEQRNFISQYFPDNEIIIQMDDDVKTIKTRPQMTFLNLIAQGVRAIEDGQGGLWGVLPNDDGRKMKLNTTRHLAHIIGSFFILRNHRDILITLTEKEDFERSIIYFRRYGSVLRYNGAGVDTKYTQTPGGLQQPGRTARMQTGISYLLTTYPNYLKTVIKPKGLDVILNWRMPPFNPQNNIT